MSISVVYWSGTGNTQAMAEAIGEGIESAGAQANVISVDQASVDALAEEDVFALGCSAMGAEELEESEMEPFVAELEGKVSGKKILLFGSYGWGDGEWRDCIFRSWKITFLFLCRRSGTGRYEHQLRYACGRGSY